jgi:hypothetical protein
VDEAIHWVGGNIEVPAMEFLKEHGLQPHHTFLDVGAGCFRCSIPMIDYLNEGNYFAIDGDHNLLERGITEVVPSHLRDRIKMVVSWEFEFELLGQDAFDYIWAQSVITHTPEQETRKLFSAIEKHLAGAAYLSYLRGDRNNADPYHWTVDDLQSFTALKVEALGDWKHPRKLEMVRLTK